MSKIFIVTSLAIDTIEPVNLDNIFTVRKENPIEFSPDKHYYLSFYKSDISLDHVPLKWKYKTIEDRDCDYNKIITHYSEDITTL